MTTTLKLTASAAAAWLLGALGSAQEPAKPAAPVQAAPPAQQEPTQEELAARLEAKLAKPFLAHGGWLTDYDLARKTAAETGKPVFIYFTRSYAH